VENLFRSDYALKSGSFIFENDKFSSVSEKKIFSRSLSTEVFIVFEGLIYNPEDFDTGTSDADTFLRSYLLIGFESTLKRLNGDFSLALFDCRNDELYLARDRFGAKPLYWSAISGHIAFSSRPLALARLKAGGTNLNADFIARYAGGHYRYIDNKPEETPYQGIFQVPAAHYARFRSGKFSLKAYWSIQEQEDHNGTDDELAQRYKDLLTDAVARRVSRVSRPAFTLSGGMDSSSILSCATNKFSNSFKVYTSIYSDKTYDEYEDVQIMRSHAAKEWFPVLVDNPNVLGLLERMIDAHEEPIATATWLSHYLVCEQASIHEHDALFSGLGGDELNAGEYEHFFYFFADLLVGGDEESLYREMDAWIKHHDHPVYKKTSEIAFDVLDRVIDRSTPGRCLVDQPRLRKYYDAINPDYYRLEDFLPIMEAPFMSYLKNRTYQDLTRETVPCCLRAEERQSASFGMQNVAPFFDHRLVEFMFRIPNRLKIQNGITKVLLREAMKGILPEETRTRIKKTGWNAPAHLWFTRGEAAQVLRDLVESRSFRERGIYKLDKVRALLDEHTRIVNFDIQAENHMMFFWQLLNLEIWFTKQR
jgi:asparagine synthase (glutamine-hydrolysing)